MDATGTTTTLKTAGTWISRIILGDLRERIVAIEVSVGNLDRKIEANINSLDRKIEANIDSLDRKIEASVDSLDRKIEANIGSLDRKIEASVGSLDRKIETNVINLDRKIETLAENMNRKTEALEKAIGKESEAREKQLAVISSSQTQMAMAVGEIQTLMRFAGVKISQPVLIVPGSPLKLTDQGKELATACGVDDLIRTHGQILIGAIRAKDPHSNYDIQEYARRVLQEFRDGPTLFDLKTYAFDKGANLDTLLDVAAIILRDEAMKEIKFDK